MKIVNYVLWAAAAVSIFSACSKKDNINVADGTRSVSVRINNDTTRADDDPAEGDIASGYSSIYIYLTDGTKVVSSDVITAAAAVKEFKTNGKSYDNISSSITNVLIVANVKDTDSGLPTAAGTAVEDIEKFAFAVASQQPDVQHNENTKQDGLNVTMIGRGALQSAEVTSGDGKMTAAVTLSPVVARMEISRELAVGDGVFSIKIDHVYINNYYSDYSLDTASLVNKGTVIDDYAGNLQNATYSAEVIAGTKADAYHVFADGKRSVMPHIILKVSGSFKNANDTEGAAFTDRYLTITKFKDDSGLIDNIEANNIYKIDLSQLTIPASVLDPTPEAGRISLAITIDVEKWNIVNVTPEL